MIDVDQRSDSRCKSATQSRQLRCMRCSWIDSVTLSPGLVDWLNAMSPFPMNQVVDPILIRGRLSWSIGKARDVSAFSATTAERVRCFRSWPTREIAAACRVIRCFRNEILSRDKARCERAEGRRPMHYRPGCAIVSNIQALRAFAGSRRGAPRPFRAPRAALPARAPDSSRSRACIGETMCLINISVSMEQIERCQVQVYLTPRLLTRVQTATKPGLFGISSQLGFTLFRTALAVPSY
jgi:hypothetical protein